ncbi:hypothetical protein K0T92_11530 [Paenibacillus oenotherae]|uniref:Uncharacterized protein n=1 Tax=Paenibacillus oenotherae TaxID=1435645 RepID=A0ABS7D689_9BACL|nr:hypothetical protein [Paenibacillus oenotherae]MBW7475381.1 hypothetical protein [Paenibacillus oenotherae]
MAMMNFIGIAAASALYSKMQDRGADAGWNPLNVQQGESVVYSNIFMIFAIITIIAAYRIRLVRASRGNGAIQTRSMARLKEKA